MGGTLSLERGPESADVRGSPNKAVRFAHWSEAPSPKAIFEEPFSATPWLRADCQGPLSTGAKPPAWSHTNSSRKRVERERGRRDAQNEAPVTDVPGEVTEDVASETRAQHSARKGSPTRKTGGFELMRQKAESRESLEKVKDFGSKR